MSATMAPTWAGRPRQREEGAANAGALSLPVATATLRPGFGHRAEDRDAVHDPNHPAVLHGADWLLGLRHDLDGILERGGHRQFGSVGGLPGFGVAHDPAECQHV